MDRLSQWLQGAFEHLELQAWRHDDDDSYPERRQPLLVLHSAIRGEQHVEASFRAPQQLTVLECTPTLLLNGSDLELGQFATKQSRQILVEEHPSHAISATSARLASSKNAKTCSRDTPG